jgi:hypothetical protein
MLVLPGNSRAGTIACAVHRVGVSSPLALLVVIVSPLAAFGQGGTDGSIAGYVSDPAGVPIPAASVVAFSSTQIGGAREATSNERGGFWLRQLSPGTFRVTASAPGRRTVVHEQVLVGISAPAELNIVMVAAAGEQVAQVVDSGPAVGTTTGHVQEVYDLDLVEAIPLPTRDGVLARMVDQVGGALGNRIRGGASNQTIFMQDGFDTRAGYPVSTAAAAYEVHSAGYGADSPAAPGGLVSVVTRTGSNRWEIDVDATAENDTLRLGDEGAWAGTYYYRINPAVAGPLLRDKLWFALAVESHLLGHESVTDPEGILSPSPAHLRLRTLGTVKITWQIDVRHRLTLLSRSRESMRSTGRRAGSTRAL